jgi:hydrogenase maturation factor
MEGMPPHAPRPSNPIDFAGSFRTSMEEAAVVEKLLSQDYIDGVISNVPINPAAWSAMLGQIGMPKSLIDITKMTIEGADHFSSLPAKYGKPIITTRFRRFAHDIVIDILKGARIPVCDTPEEAARAMHALVQYAEIRKRTQGQND